MACLFTLTRINNFDFLDRLEAEQLGNIDMYAAVRDVRLPYDAAVADDDDDDDYELRSRDSWGSKSRRATQILRPSQVKLDDHP